MVERIRRKRKRVEDDYEDEEEDMDSEEEEVEEIEKPDKEQVRIVSDSELLHYKMDNMSASLKNVLASLNELIKHLKKN